MLMRLIYSSGKIEIWAVSEAWGTDYYVYGVYASRPTTQSHKLMGDKRKPPRRVEIGATA
jgi:hypothetical protein